MPASSSFLTWSFIKLISGDTTRQRFSALDRRELVAKRFPASRGHDPQQIAAALQGVDQFFLPGPKRIVAEDGFQQSDSSSTESRGASQVI